MDTEFWQQRWEQNRLGFHEPEANPALIDFIDRLVLADGGRVFVPLCGKTLDIGWLLSRGYRVAGVELIELAVERLFDDLGVAPAISETGSLRHYRAEDIDIFAGDVFDVPREFLGPVDAVYDRAALVALPEQTRQRYSLHLMRITDAAPQLLVTFEYDQDEMPGPPFSISDDEVLGHYDGAYSVARVRREKIVGGLKGCAAQESVWVLLPSPR